MTKLSVTSLLNYIKRNIDQDKNIQNIYVVGEISNYRFNTTSHNHYFTLKEGNAAIKCVIFRVAGIKLDFKPKDGLKVVAFGRVSLFSGSGEIQLFVYDLKEDGVGDLHRQFIELKEKLTKEGYFASEHKIELGKKYIENVAILVGDKSRAMSDIMTIFARRWPLCKTTYYPVLVQGNEAAKDIIKNLKAVDSLGYDAIILSRGGGSYEDLFCFNDEELVKTIYDLKTFIITGVGHEDDYTLVDFVADLRAPTPTAAVELITPDINKVRESIYNLTYTMTNSIESRLNSYTMRYDYLLEKIAHFNSKLTNIRSGIDNHLRLIHNILNNKISIYSKQIDNGMKNINKDLDYKINDHRNRYQKLRNSLKVHLNENILRLDNKIDNSLNNIQKDISVKLNKNQINLRRLATLLKAYSTDNVLSRGYTLVFQKGKLIKTKAELASEEFNIRFIDGEIKAIERK